MKDVLEIRQEDIDAAVAANVDLYWIGRCCPIYQAVRRLIPSVPFAVYNIYIRRGDRTSFDGGRVLNLPIPLQEITSLTRSQWPQIQPGSFACPGLDNFINSCKQET